MNKKHIETILRTNGVDPSSPIGEIRSVLKSARYAEDEIDSAITILREEIDTSVVVKESGISDGLNKLFRSHENLQPKEISELLGITVTLSETVEFEDDTSSFLKSRPLLILMASFALATIGILSYMLIFKVGFFYSSV